MSGRQWTPYELTVLMHHYASLDRFQHGSAPLYLPTINRFMEQDLIEYREGIPRTTAKGDHFIEMLLQTPMPRQVWKDPRDGKEILAENAANSK